MKGSLVTIYAAAILIALVSVAWAFKVDTHRAVNERATESSGLDEHLKTHLGFRHGVEEEILSLRVKKWVGFGGVEEDLFLNNQGGGAYNRSRHHFQNPLLSWNEAGLNGRCFLFPISGQASVRWAQSDVDQAGGSARWSDARHLFLSSLTLPTKTERDSAAADLFKTLGQQMHLVSDLAVPAHARNDIHCTPNAESFETWMNAGENLQLLATMQPIGPDPSIFSVGVPIQDQIARVPVARLWDTGAYRAERNADVTLSGPVGLSEYTSANFFSKRTIFSSSFPYPARTSVGADLVIGVDPKTGRPRQYFAKVRDGQPLNRLAAPGALYNYVPDALKDKNIGLDGSIFAEYATHLLPRAIGYSAALLDYFFRGKLEATVAPDPAEPQKLLFTGRNASNEALQDGTLKVYGDYAPEGRVELGSWAISGPIAPGSELLPGQPVSVVPPADRPVPERYMVVYQGSLGEEKKDNPPGFGGAVIGKAAKYVGVIEQIFVSQADGDVYFRNGTLVTRLNVRSQLRPGSLIFRISWGARNDTFLVEGGVPGEDASYYYVFMLNRPGPDKVFRDPPVASLVRSPELVDGYFPRPQLPPFAQIALRTDLAQVDGNLDVILHGYYCVDIPDPYNPVRSECHILLANHSARTVLFAVSPFALGAPDPGTDGFSFTGVFATQALYLAGGNPADSRIVVDGSQNILVEDGVDVYRGYLSVVDGNGAVVATLLNWETDQSTVDMGDLPQHSGTHFFWTKNDTRVYLSSLVDGTSTEVAAGDADFQLFRGASLLPVAPDHLLRTAGAVYFARGWTMDGTIVLPRADTPGFPPEDPELAGAKRLAALPPGVSMATAPRWQVIQDPDLLR
jgi:hypothetical protein